MSGTIRGPEPPFPGAVYQARTKSGRRWEVAYEIQAVPAFNIEAGWYLRPLGDDARGVTINEDGETIGGVRPIVRTAEQLRNPKKWRHVGVTARAAT